jgi:redox-sensitive bicupin YhaK (pirin superfamily)
VRLDAGARFSQSVAAGHTAFLYPYAGSLSVRGRGAHPFRPAGRRAVRRRQHRGAGRRGRGPFLLLAARPIGEPVVQYGPFVMNTREEIEQALADYRDGRLTA